MCRRAPPLVMSCLIVWVVCNDDRNTLWQVAGDILGEAMASSSYAAPAVRSPAAHQAFQKVCRLPSSRLTAACGY